MILPKKTEMNFDAMSKRFEHSVETVLDEDIQPISKTELVKTLTYAHKIDTDANIYFRILKTTYYDTSACEAVAGLNTDALNVLFQINRMDICEEMMIQNRPGVLYKKDDIAYLCWNYDPEVTFVLEYTPSKTPDSEIIKIAESVVPKNE